MTKSQFEEHFREEVLPHVVARYEQDGIPDKPARRETWNDTVDAYIRDRQLPESAGNWSHPRWLETWRPSGSGRRAHHAVMTRKRSPAQLDREIADALGRGQSKRAHAHAMKRDRAAELIANYGTWSSSYSNEDFDRAQSLAGRLTDIDREEGRPAPAHGYSKERYAQAKQVVRDTNRYGEKQQKLSAARRAGQTHARKKKISPQEAKQLIQSDDIDFGRDFFELSSSEVQRVLEVAKLAGYRKRKDAPGSTARMYFQYLSRLKNHATKRAKHTVYDLVEVNKRTKKERVLHEHFSTKEHAKKAADEYKERTRPDVTYHIRSRQVPVPPY